MIFHFQGDSLYIVLSLPHKCFFSIPPSYETLHIVALLPKQIYRVQGLKGHSGCSVDLRTGELTGNEGIVLLSLRVNLEREPISEFCKLSRSFNYLKRNLIAD